MVRCRPRSGDWTPDPGREPDGSATVRAGRSGRDGTRRGRPPGRSPTDRPEPARARVPSRRAGNAIGSDRAVRAGGGSGPPPSPELTGRVPDDPIPSGRAVRQRRQTIHSTVRRAIVPSLPATVDLPVPAARVSNAHRCRPPTRSADGRHPHRNRRGDPGSALSPPPDRSDSRTGSAPVRATPWKSSRQKRAAGT